MIISCFTHLYCFRGRFIVSVVCSIVFSANPAKSSVRYFVYEQNQGKAVTINYLNLVKSTTSMARCFLIETFKALMLISL